MKKIILVTGGSRGLGRSIVEKLSENDTFKLYFTYYKSGEEAAQLELLRNNIKSIKCDQRNEEMVAGTVENIVSSEGGIYALVNNACPSFRPCSLTDTGWDQFRDLIDTNLKGAYYFTREASRHMKEKNQGRIINVLTSYVLGVPPEKLSFYVTAKYALMGFSRACASELVKYGITVNSVSPGLMKTDLTSYLPRKYLEVAAAKHPMKRLAATDDTAGVVEFLLSEASQFINGINIPVNGGEEF